MPKDKEDHIFNLIQMYMKSINEEVLKGLSIEELEERAEFAAVAVDEQAQPGWCDACAICSC